MLLVAASHLAYAQEVLKQADSRGNVTYSDKPVPGKAVVKTLSFPPMTEAEKAEIEARRAGIAREADAIRARFREKRDALDKNDLDLKLAYRMLSEGEKALKNGLAPQPGERTGRRLNDTYFTRIAGLEQRITDARQRLERAYREKDKLR
jgi:hypothetical protein